jgi:hypothetical protein
MYGWAPISADNVSHEVAALFKFAIFEVILVWNIGNKKFNRFYKFTKEVLK